MVFPWDWLSSTSTLAYLNRSVLSPRMHFNHHRIYTSSSRIRTRFPRHEDHQYRRTMKNEPYFNGMPISLPLVTQALSSCACTTIILPPLTLGTNQGCYILSEAWNDDPIARCYPHLTTRRVWNLGLVDESWNPTFHIYTYQAQTSPPGSHAPSSARRNSHNLVVDISPIFLQWCLDCARVWTALNNRTAVLQCILSPLRVFIYTWIGK